jgi:hypothetical protein
MPGCRTGTSNASAVGFSLRLRNAPGVTQALLVLHRFLLSDTEIRHFTDVPEGRYDLE